MNRKARLPIQKRHLSLMKCLFLWHFLAVVFLSTVNADDLCLSEKQQLSNVNDWGHIASIIDGDTVHLKDGRKVRFIGINTPELGHHGEASQAYGRQAYEALIQLLKGQNKIGLTYDKDKKDRYQRTLAYINLPDGRSVEQILLSKGLAHSIIVPPNDRRIKCYRNIESQARKANLGLWRLSENKWIKAAHLAKKSRGLRYVSGTVLAYSEGKKNIYLKLSSKLSIRIAKKDKKYFLNLRLKELIGKTLKVRGWVNTYRGRQSIHVRTAYDFELPEE